MTGVGMPSSPPNLTTMPIMDSSSLIRPASMSPLHRGLDARRAVIDELQGIIHHVRVENHGFGLGHRHHFLDGLGRHRPRFPNTAISPIVTRVSVPSALMAEIKTNLVQRIWTMSRTTSTVAPVLLRTSEIACARGVTRPSNSPTTIRRNWLYWPMTPGPSMAAESQVAPPRGAPRPPPGRSAPPHPHRSERK